MVGVIVADEDTCECHVVTRNNREDVIYGVGGIDDDAFSRVQVANEIHVVGH